MKPIKIGFDLSITSATKYYSGHSDVMAGTLAVSKKAFNKVKWYNNVSGYRLSSDDAYLVIRGLRTLDLRLKKHYENTLKVIGWLSTQKKLLKFYILIKEIQKIINYGKSIILELQDCWV